MRGIIPIIVSIYFVVQTLGDVDESSQLYSDFMAIVLKQKTRLPAAQCKHDPDRHAPWLFRNATFLDDPWYRIYNINESTLPILSKLGVTTPHPELFEVPEEILEERWALAITERAVPLCNSFQNCSREDALDDVLGYREFFYTRKVVMFVDVWVDYRGLIVDRATCKAVRNGACLPRPFEFKKEVSSHHYPLVISLATSWRGTWHFPMENIVALAHIDRAILDKAHFHLPAKNEYITSWLQSLVIPTSRMLEGTVSCRVLLVSEMRCGEPFFAQLEWMRQSYLPQETAQQRKAIGFDYSSFVDESTTAGATTTIAKRSVNKQLSVVLVDRTKSRAVVNMLQMYTSVQAFAAANNMQFVLHADRALPISLYEQMRRFAAADIVVAPHGAGLLFTTFMPYTSCIVEFSNTRNPHCYAHIAYVRNMSYVMYDMVNNTVDLDKMKTGLSRCLLAVKANKASYGIT